MAGPFKVGRLQRISSNHFKEGDINKGKSQV